MKTKLNFSKMFLLVILIVGFFATSKSVFAVPPSCPEKGFCMVDGQVCPGGTIGADASCTGGAYNGNACCVAGTVVSLACGREVPADDVGNYNCTCDNGLGFIPFERVGNNYACCGWVTVVGSIDGGRNFCAFSPNTEVGPGGDILNGPNNATLDRLNPLKISGSGAAADLSTPGGIISRLLSFLFPLAGLILFLLVSWGGFEILLNSANQKGMEAGKNRITAAIIGFILLFSAYWMAQIVEIVFGIKIL